MGSGESDDPDPLGLAGGYQVELKWEVSDCTWYLFELPASGNYIHGDNPGLI